jgi:hypothetical protein
VAIIDRATQPASAMTVHAIDLLFAPPLLDESDATRQRNVNACGKWMITIYTSLVLSQ